MSERLKSREISTLGLNRAKHHLLFCGGPDCCSRKQGEKLWEFLKASIKEHNIPAQRTNTKCLRICHCGPWLVVYPDGIWYGNLTQERITRILDEHLTRGFPIDEWIAHQHPLSGVSPETST